mgnify:CR=1 FL=1
MEYVLFIRNALISAFTLFVCLPAIQGQTLVWADVHETGINVSQDDRLIIPSEYRTLRLNFAQLKSLLATAPEEAEVVAGNPGTEVAFPMPDGGMARFLVWSAPVMQKDLANQYPDIQSFAGKGIDLPTAYIRFDVSPAGFHGMMLRTGKGSVYIDPYARGNTEYYIAYFKKDFTKRDGNRMICLVDESMGSPLPDEMPVDARTGDCGNLRTYRLALACTGEYANYHGSFGINKAPALAAMNTSMTRVNGVYEIDCGIRMIIIGNNTDIIYTDPDNDPYTNGNGNTMLGQNQTTCDGVIGTGNYDIGHVFSTGGGGIASLNSPCSALNKAKGVTGSPSPVGDPFDIDYVAHEMGHQYGADHTQYNNCNRVNASAMEPGSASTIMGYAGICPPDVQNNSDAYFHARSLQQIGVFVTTGNGNSCDVPVASGNQSPVVNNVIDKSIPISTPFILTAIASDPNNDPLSFCWEQINAFSNPAQSMPPVSTNTSGPMFRTFDPVGSPARYFPNFPDVLSNVDPIWEELPSISRSMAFRITVRDNHANGGCTTQDDVTLTASASAGPFLVTSPNSNLVYPSGSVQTVTWNVANTTASPVSCANVDILITTDDGVSFDLLLANTPNDGSQSVTMPNIASTQCRIMVMCSNNYFYDISNTTFELQIGLPVELIDFDATLQGEAVELMWSTASETDNKGFYIERSVGNGYHFKEIGWKDGHGTNSGVAHYSFTDNNLQQGGAHYYRLRQVDRDGKIRISDIRTVQVGSNNPISVQPNPAGHTIRVNDTAELSSLPAQIRIWNLDGELEIEQVYEAGASIDVEALPNGIYRVEIFSDGVSKDAMFIKAGY